VENYLQQNSVRDVWSGMEKLTGFGIMWDHTDGRVEVFQLVQFRQTQHAAASCYRPHIHVPTASLSHLSTFTCNYKIYMKINFKMNNHLILNTNKTKEMIVDFRRTSSQLNTSPSSVKRRLRITET